MDKHDSPCLIARQCKQCQFKGFTGVALVGGLGDLGGLLIVFGVYGMTFAGKMRKLSDKHQIS